MSLLQSDLVYVSHFSPSRFCSRRPPRISSAGCSPPTRLRSHLVVAALEAPGSKPSICTADELHRVAVADSDWSIALWRYVPPPPKAERRNHPLLLLSGIGTNAIGFDLTPQSSFARYLSNQGFDTWILELRGSGLSTLIGESRETKKPFRAMSDRVDDVLPTEAPSTIISGAHAETFVSSIKGKKMAAEFHDTLISKAPHVFK